MGLRAGSLNERLKILREVRVDSDFGGSETEYQFKCYIRAYHNAKDGNRTIVNDEIVYTNTKTFEIRFYQPIDNEDIIEWYGDKYRIVSITPDRKNQKKVLTVEKIVV